MLADIDADVPPRHTMVAYLCVFVCRIVGVRLLRVVMVVTPTTTYPQPPPIPSIQPFAVASWLAGCLAEFSDPPSRPLAHTRDTRGPSDPPAHLPRCSVPCHPLSLALFRMALSADTAYVSAVINAPIEAVWALNDDFVAIARWMNLITSARMRDGRPATEIGAIRELDIQGGISVAERLVALDPETHSCTYEFVSSPFPVEGYRATLSFKPITMTNQTFGEWRGHWQVSDAHRETSHKTFEGIYTTGFACLQTHFSA